ncbi:Pectin lyase-like superfamily protein [Euphorbia peplus]|nr:Pectin lyase-like superfamily protein [Euphorbia peplus]
MRVIPVFVVSISIWLSFYSRLCGGIECKYERVNTIYVGKSGKVQFKTVQEAIDHSVPANNDKWIKIHIAAGRYKEQVVIRRDQACVFLEGEGRKTTVIYYNAHQQTDSSATFFSDAENFYAKGLTFQNSYNRALEGDPPNPNENEIKQAVAAKVFGDKSAFRFCGFIGLQDTLWDENGRHYFYQCYIEGAIDFIFGKAQSFYQECMINSTAGKLASRLRAGYITAQGRSDSSTPSGFVFYKGSVTGSGQSYLGRAYGPYSTVIFHQTHLDDVIVPEGWDAWSFVGKEKNLIYSEVNCEGAGSNTGKRVPWMKKLQDGQLTNNFSLSSFVDQDKWLARLPN